LNCIFFLLSLPVGGAICAVRIHPLRGPLPATFDAGRESGNSLAGFTKRGCAGEGNNSQKFQLHRAQP
jgi:hypothetical protein